MFPRSVIKQKEVTCDFEHQTYHSFDWFESRGGQRKPRQLAVPPLKTQLQIGKDIIIRFGGEKNKYAALSPYEDFVLRKYARKYREYLAQGTINKKIIGVNQFKEKSRIKRVLFLVAEKKLVDQFEELRRVGIRVDGSYLQANMLQFVQGDKGADEEKMKSFKASDAWLSGFLERKGISNHNLRDLVKIKT